MLATEAARLSPLAAEPGEDLVIDWISEGPWQVFCAALAWSRYRFVRLARNQRANPTLGFLTECFEDLEGVPAVVLADRTGCLKGGLVANVVVPSPDYVRFATHFGFRPDFCEAADPPESKGVVEHPGRLCPVRAHRPRRLLGHRQRGQRQAREWCGEVNGRLHSEIAAVPAERLGGCSIIDDHYGGPRRSPARGCVPARARNGPSWP